MEFEYFHRTHNDNKRKYIIVFEKKSTLTFRMHGQMRDADRKKGMVEHIRFHSTISIGN